MYLAFALPFGIQIKSFLFYLLHSLQLGLTLAPDTLRAVARAILICWWWKQGAWLLMAFVVRLCGGRLTIKQPKWMFFTLAGMRYLASMIGEKFGSASAGLAVLVCAGALVFSIGFAIYFLKSLVDE